MDVYQETAQINLFFNANVLRQPKITIHTCDSTKSRDMRFGNGQVAKIEKRFLALTSGRKKPCSLKRHMTKKSHDMKEFVGRLKVEVFGLYRTYRFIKFNMMKISTAIDRFLLNDIQLPYLSNSNLGKSKRPITHGLPLSTFVFAA